MEGVFLSPLRGSTVSPCFQPTACALGCILTPIRGLGQRAYVTTFLGAGKSEPHPFASLRAGSVSLNAETGMEHPLHTLRIALRPVRLRHNLKQQNLP